MSASLFSFNGKGACDECKGLGFKQMDMNFLGDVQIKCETCEGKKYKEKVLRYKVQSKSILDVLSMIAVEAVEFFSLLKSEEDSNQLIPSKVIKPLQSLIEVG